MPALLIASEAGPRFHGRQNHIGCRLLTQKYSMARKTAWERQTKVRRRKRHG